jgi:hypothetical protein
VSFAGHVIDGTPESVEGTMNGNAYADVDRHAQGDAQDSQPRFPFFAKEMSQGKETN